MRWIYVSPHLDDAVFSSGGLMFEQTRAGISVEIWTVMCGVPKDARLTDFAKALHRQWGTSSSQETIRIRRAENEQAASILEVKTVYLDFLDSMYRRGTDGDALYTNSFVRPHRAESDLPATIMNIMSQQIRSDDILVCPLALGGHVDHVIVRRAVEMLKRPQFYAADIPYLLNKPHALRQKTGRMNESVHKISETGLKSWIDAANAYKSQIATEFHTPERMQKMISAYWAERKGICLWEDKSNRRKFNFRLHSFLHFWPTE